MTRIELTIMMLVAARAQAPVCDWHNGRNNLRSIRNSFTLGSKRMTRQLEVICTDPTRDPVMVCTDLA